MCGEIKRVIDAAVRRLIKSVYRACTIAAGLISCCLEQKGARRKSSSPSNGTNFTCRVVNFALERGCFQLVPSCAQQLNMFFCLGDKSSTAKLNMISKKLSAQVWHIECKFQGVLSKAENIVLYNLAICHLKVTMQR